MKCPFVDRDCVGRDCVGWSNGMCFSEIQTNKLEVITALISKLSNDVKNSMTLKINNHEPVIEPSQKEETQINRIPRTAQWAELWKPSAKNVSTSDLTLAIDFGTAFSKIAFKIGPDYISTPIPLSRVAYKTLDEFKLIDETTNVGRDFMEDSVLYIDDDGTIFCGTLANHKYYQATSAGSTRLAIRNLKQLLIGGGADLPLHKNYFPGEDKLSIQDVLAIYLAYLIRLAKNYASSSKNEYKLDIDSSLRNFSMPVWSNEEYRDNVKNVFKGAIIKAYCLEKWLENKLVTGVSISIVRDALNESNKYKEELQNIIGIDVTEPVAAGYRRIVNLKVEEGQPHHIFVIDVGAGSTDYAFYSISQPRNTDNKMINISNIQIGISKGVAVWDNALKSLLYKKVKEICGANSSNHEFQIFSAKIETQLSALKEKILASAEYYDVDASPILSEPLRIYKKDLNHSPAVEDAISAIGDGLNKFIDELTMKFSKDHFDPKRTEFLVTGGGSFIQSIINCIEDCAARIGPTFRRNVIFRDIPPEYRGIPNMPQVYPMLAVSLGATERNYPSEGVLPLITQYKQQPVLGGYFTKGI